MTPMLQRIFGSEGGGEALDVLMKYLYVAYFIAPTSMEKYHLIFKGLALFLSTSQLFLWAYG